jgi:lysophospholipase L1-like esterase
MIKPFRSLLLLGYVAILLAVALYFLPSELKLSQTLTIRTFTIRSIFEKQDANYADISDITKKFAAPATDSVYTANTSNKKLTVNAKKPAYKDTLNARFRIQYPEESNDALLGLFQSLQSLPSSKQLIRVLHYGDSQVEGDRITSFLRNKLQERFGGCGVGLVPLLDPLGNRTSIMVKADYPWQKIFVYGNGYNKSNQNSYGILGSYYKYSFHYRVEPPKDSARTVLVNDTNRAKPVYAYKKWQNVSVNLHRSRLAHPLESRFENIKILYRNQGAPFELSIKTEQDTLDRQKIDSSSSYAVYKHPFKETFNQVKITFGSSQSPEFFGMALDCNQGVAVDNIPFRGSSGIEFTRMNRTLLQQQIQSLNVKCIILQFGVNVVPYVINDYTFYEEQFYNQLKLLKSIAPGVSILVVGVSDMSRKEGEFYVSYPNIEKIRDAQRKAAFRANCAFWDLYEAMGGKNSMPSWVFAKPALANKDFTHFTARGASLVSEMLYKALLSEYEKFNSL